MLFLTISKGCRADAAVPILEVSDQLFVERVLNSMFSLATQTTCDEDEADGEDKDDG